ncbi:MAG: helix-turn-helix domain-containing protein [Chitinophagales bacterium]
MAFILFLCPVKICCELKNKRDNKKLSQQEIADYVQVSQRTYSNFESDISKPSTQ